MSGKRYFEMVEGTSSKFWEVWRDGVQVYTRYGKIGANGQITVKNEGTDAKAQVLFDKLVKEKTGKGYVEKNGGGGAAAPAPAAAAPAPAAAAPAPAAPAPAAPKAEAPKAAAPKAEAPKAAAPAAAAPKAVVLPAGTRRFEVSEGGSNKFWEITLSGDSHTVRYGKIGTPGQEKTKAFGSAAEAQRDADKLIGEKTKKGYQEIVGSDAPAAPELDAAALAEKLAMIDRAPDAPDAYLVLADWLQSLGHPWGTLIALHHGIATADSAARKAELAKAERELLQSDGAAILGDLARAGRPTRFEWHYGFITEAVIASATDKLVLGDRLRTLFSLPAARRLTKLTLHAQPARFEPHPDWDTSTDDVVDPWPDAIPALAGAPATLTAISFGEPPPTSVSAYVKPPDFGALSKALPRLTSIEVQGMGEQGISGIDFSELRTLELRFAHTSGQDLDALRAAKLPKLERLSVWLGGSSYCILDDVYEPNWDREDEDASKYPASYPVTDLEKMEIHDVNVHANATHVATFLGADWPASLKHLGLNSATLDEAMLRAICEGPLVRKLETLDLSGGTLNDARAQVLVDNRDRLSHLKSLDLSRNALTKAGMDAISAVLPQAVFGKQSGNAFAPELVFRYVATME